MRTARVDFPLDEAEALGKILGADWHLMTLPEIVAAKRGRERLRTAVAIETGEAAIQASGSDIVRLSQEAQRRAEDRTAQGGRL